MNFYSCNYNILEVNTTQNATKPTSGRVDRAPATGTVNSGSIPGRFKPNTTKTGFRKFSAWRSALKGIV